MDNLEKIDRRVKRTHKFLQQALIDLTLEQGYDNITIREITERADVGYATFFRHYADKEALLGDVLHAMKDDFRALLEPFSMVTAPERTGELIFNYVRKNCDLCRVLLHTTDTLTLLAPVQEIGLEEAVPLLRASEQGDIPADLAVDHLMSALVMLIRWWLDHDMPYPPDRMGRIAAQLIIRPVIDAFQ
jgi:AcrR family transcriptional regulator